MQLVNLCPNSCSRPGEGEWVDALIPNLQMTRKVLKIVAALAKGGNVFPRQAQTVNAHFTCCISGTTEPKRALKHKPGVFCRKIESVSISLQVLVIEFNIIHEEGAGKKPSMRGNDC